MKDTKGFKAWMAVLVTVGMLAVIFLLMQVEVPPAGKDVLLVVLGALISIVKDVFGYYFGSSEGSQRKTEMLQATAETPQ